ncbi:MAG: TrkA family potassium uptake protein [Spirochaetaceae bacterium]|nr:MAG: TrkA family potassium uptake protein [Spirochaetaceae bacterium]
MHIIVVGCGNVGAQLVTFLSIEGHDVAIIDKNSEAFKRLGTTFNGIAVPGYGFDSEVLEEAGIMKCEAFAAVTNEDNTNMMSAEMASKIYKVPRVIVRLYNTERESDLLRLGLDYVCSTSMVSHSIMEKLTNGHGRHVVVRKDVELFEFVAGKTAHKKKVKDLQIPNEFRICLVTRDGQSFIPWRESLIHEHDTLLAVVKDDAHAKIGKYVGQGK